MLDLKPIPTQPQSTPRGGAAPACPAADPPGQTAASACTDYATIAHDLQTPVAVIKGHTQLLQRWLDQGRPFTGAQVREALDAIATDADRLQTMIEELLRQLRPQRDRSAAPTRERTALAPLVHRAINECGDPRIQLELWPEPLEGWWEPRRILRVIENLLSNARKYSAPDATIEVVLGREDDGEHHVALLSIHDHGIGIPAAEVPRLFEPFYRASNAGSRRDSAGVGLASVHQIVEEHGGIVAVSSELGQGSTFTIRLPCS